MAGKRRAYAVIVDGDTLCSARGGETVKDPAIFGTAKQAEALVCELVRLGYYRDDYTIVKVELK